MSTKAKPAFEAILGISNHELATAITFKIEETGRFTTVTDNDPSDILPRAISLLALSDWYHGQEYRITHIGLLTKSPRVATEQVRLKGTNIITLKSSLTIDQILEQVPEYTDDFIRDLFTRNYQKVFSHHGRYLYDAIIRLCPDHAAEIKQLFSNFQSPLVIPRNFRTEEMAIEKDALGLCLDIFGSENRGEILGSWRKPKESLGSSFLNGLDSYIKVYEDDVINQDLNVIPGWTVINKYLTGVVEFEDEDGETLTVINANRKPLEKALGVDLIYYQKACDAYTFVQYKMMENKNAEKIYYYNPNQQNHNEELERMKKLKTVIDQEARSNILLDYRLSSCPIYFKLCRKMIFKRELTSIATGAYIPLDQWELLLNDASTKGPKGGIQLGFHTLNKRYLQTNEFSQLVQRGFVGTQSPGSKKIGPEIENLINSGHSIIFAIDNKKLKSYSKRKTVYTS